MSVPVAVDLARQKAWTPLNPRQSRFFVARFHLMLKHRQLPDPARCGEVVGTYETPKGVTENIVRSINLEANYLHVESSLERSLVESQVMTDLATELGTRIEPGAFGSLDTKAKAEIQNRLASSFSKEFRFEKSVRTRLEKKIEITYEVAADTADSLVTVLTYKRSAYDVYLAFVDYLYVDYLSSLFNIRKKRNKKPSYGGGPRHAHPNVVKLYVPLATIEYWKLLPESARMLREAEYTLEVDDPEDIRILPPQDPHTYHVAMPPVPSLYQLSNVAFPLHWAKAETQWTEAQLLEIEENEPDGPVWKWQARGRGRKSA